MTTSSADLLINPINVQVILNGKPSNPDTIRICRGETVYQAIVEAFKDFKITGPFASVGGRIGKFTYSVDDVELTGHPALHNLRKDCVVYIRV